MIAPTDAERARASRSSRRRLILQGALCVLCMLVGAFYPTLLDWSKTATEQEVTVVLAPGGQAVLQTQERRTYPFSPASVVLVNDALQFSLAVLAVATKEGLQALVADKGLILKMLPLGIIYSFGELLTLRSVQKGSGPVYVVIANMKLVVAAVMSRVFFGRSRSMPWLHWLELVLISVAAAMYTLAEAGSMGTQWHWEGAWMALAKSSLVAFSSVFCEHTYQGSGFRSALAWQAFWGLVTAAALVATALSGVAARGLAAELRDDMGRVAFFSAGPAYPLCGSAAHQACQEGLLHGLALAGSCRCVSSRGWDLSTLLAVLADLSNAVSSALVFKRLGAVAKYVCRASSAVPMYAFYCAAGRAAWDLRVFSVVLYLCGQVSLYTLHRHRAAQASEDGWAGDYGAAARAGLGATKEAKRV